ncbi:MAG: CvpA family protein [Gammaproteobacteria bacterium]|nr:CvpA family protein [Gammaproteobacteria bacterium]MDH5650800.1 CvpA family protein [Gammaproteobacteria bacterium]
MIWVDFIIIGIIILSAIVSSIRGFVREALSLAGWVVAFWVALTFSGGLSLLFERSITDPVLRLIASFLLLFVATLIVASIVSYFSIQLVERSGMTRADRSIGVVFGVLRGILIVTAMVMFSGLTPFPQTPSWDNSFLLYYFEGLAVWLRDLMPADVAKSFVF